jgi:hypothetical protein
MAAGPRNAFPVGLAASGGGNSIASASEPTELDWPSRGEGGVNTSCSPLTLNGAGEHQGMRFFNHRGKKTRDQQNKRGGKHDIPSADFGGVGLLGAMRGFVRGFSFWVFSISGLQQDGHRGLRGSLLLRQCRRCHAACRGLVCGERRPVLCHR